MMIAMLSLQMVPLSASEPIQPYLESGKSGLFNYAVYNKVWLASSLQEGDSKAVSRVAITGVMPGADGSIVIPPSIGNHEVYGIDGSSLEADPRIRTISIPKTVRFLQPGTLNRWPSLEYIDIADDHPDFASVDGVMFDKRKATLLAYPGGRRGEYKFPASTTAIGPGAFSLSPNLKSLTIPVSVTDIGGHNGEVFLGCINIERVDLPETVTNIGQKSFQDCERLQEITIPPKVTAIPFGLFWRCSNLTRVSLPEGITSIGNYAFAGCTKLTLPRLPASLTTIGAYAFKDCKGLTDLEIPAGVTDIGMGAFQGNELEIPGQR